MDGQQLGGTMDIYSHRNHSNDMEYPISPASPTLPFRELLLGPHPSASTTGECCPMEWNVSLAS